MSPKGYKPPYPLTGGLMVTLFLNLVMSKNTYEEFIRKIFDTEEEFQCFLNSIHNSLPKSIKILESRIEINQVKKLFEKFGWKLEKTYYKDLEDIFYVYRQQEKLAL